MTAKAAVDFEVGHAVPRRDTKNEHSQSYVSLFVTQAYFKRYLGLAVGLGLK